MMQVPHLIVVPTLELDLVQYGWIILAVLAQNSHYFNVLMLEKESITVDILKM